MAIHRSRKRKETPNYQFLVSWEPKSPSQARVKGESASSENLDTPSYDKAKRANLLAKDGTSARIKKDIVRSLILVSFILILEVVVYLALHRV